MIFKAGGPALCLGSVGKVQEGASMKVKIKVEMALDFTLSGLDSHSVAE